MDFVSINGLHDGDTAVFSSCYSDSSIGVSEVHLEVVRLHRVRAVPQLSGAPVCGIG